MTPVKFTIQNTKKYGRGIFASKDINRGEVIHILQGEKLDVMDFVNHINTGCGHPNDPLQVGRRTYLALDIPSLIFNHSCDPNAGIRKRSELFALRDIAKGQEITYDYSATIAPTEWLMKCQCGSQHCRGTIGDITSLPKRQLAKYKKLGAIQRYMKSVLKEIEADTYQIPKYEIQALEQLGSNKFN